MRTLQFLAWFFRLERYFADRAGAIEVERELADRGAELRAARGIPAGRGRAARDDRGTMPNAAIGTTVERPWR